MNAEAELSQLVSGLICTGFSGSEPDAALLAEIGELSPAGIVLFSRNVTTPEGTRALVEAIRAVTGKATFVALDQEGGRVARLRKGFAPLPSMMAVGACGDPQLAERLGRTIAGEVTRAGADVDFAPVLDLALEPTNTVIGTRAFGDDPASVATLGAALLRGLQSGGVAATAKHFPGHGATALDSHFALPHLDASVATLRARELVPFARAIAAGTRAIMTAHVVVSALDANAAATLSSTILKDVLRRELAFEGVCFTDALEMAAIAGSVGSARAAVRAIAAGADCVLAAEGLELARAVRAALCDAVTSGELPLARVREARARIGRLRAGLPEAEPHSSVQEKDVAQLIARRAITVVHGEARLDPSVPVTLVSFEGAAFDGAADGREDTGSLNVALRRRRFRSELMRVPLDPNDDQLAQLLELIRAQDHQLVILMRRAHLHRGQREATVALLDAAPRSVAISVLEPFDAPLAQRARAVLCSYGDGECALEALADVLSGCSTATGRLPVRLPDSAA